jgi:hypothetical protein
MYELLDDTDHPESLTIEEAFELGGLASIAALSGNIYSDEIVAMKIKKDAVEKRRIEWLAKWTARQSMEPVKPKIIKAIPKVLKEDHCDICKLNREIEMIFWSPDKEILESIVYNQLKARLENALAEAKEDPSPRTTGRVNFVANRIRTFLTSSIGEQHAQ